MLASSAVWMTASTGWQPYGGICRLRQSGGYRGAVVSRRSWQPSWAAAHPGSHARASGLRIVGMDRPDMACW